MVITNILSYILECHILAELFLSKRKIHAVATSLLKDIECCKSVIINLNLYCGTNFTGTKSMDKYVHRNYRLN